MIDSPLQNLAMVRDALDGTSALAGIGVRNDVATLLAVTFGTAADKNMPVTADTVMAVSVILGQPMNPSNAGAIAANAEQVRIAILAAHG